MSKTFRRYEPDQMLLMPVALQEWLPADLSRAARRCTTAAEESCTTGTMRKD